jgi:uncharacterized membrane protein
VHYSLNFSPMPEHPKANRELIRIGKHLSEIITVKDLAGNLIHKTIKPLMVEVYPRDIMQLIVGATLLAIPISLTEEVWKLGTTLPWMNIFLIFLFSFSFTSLFIFHNFYRNHFEKHKWQFLKRIILLYSISLSVSFGILYAIGQAPGGAEWIITFKRMVIISFPASMSAAVADMIK